MGCIKYKTWIKWTTLLNVTFRNVKRNFSYKCLEHERIKKLFCFLILVGIGVDPFISHGGQKSMRYFE